MSRVVVIGATGHIGSYLVPRLVEAGHAVVTVARGEASHVSHSAARVRISGIAWEDRRNLGVRRRGQKSRTDRRAPTLPTLSAPRSTSPNPGEEGQRSALVE